MGNYKENIENLYSSFSTSDLINTDENLYTRGLLALTKIEQSFNYLMDEINYSRLDDDWVQCSNVFIKELQSLNQNEIDAIIDLLCENNLLMGTQGYNAKPSLQIIKELNLNSKVRQQESQREIDRRINILRGKLIPLRKTQPINSRNIVKNNIIKSNKKFEDFLEDKHKHKSELFKTVFLEHHKKQYNQIRMTVIIGLLKDFLILPEKFDVSGLMKSVFGREINVNNVTKKLNGDKNGFSTYELEKDDENTNCGKIHSEILSQIQSLLI